MSPIARLTQADGWRTEGRADSHRFDALRAGHTSKSAARNVPNECVEPTLGGERRQVTLRQVIPFYTVFAPRIDAFGSTCVIVRSDEESPPRSARALQAVLLPTPGPELQRLLVG